MKKNLNFNVILIALCLNFNKTLSVRETLKTEIEKVKAITHDKKQASKYHVNLPKYIFSFFEFTNFTQDKPRTDINLNKKAGNIGNKPLLTDYKDSQKPEDPKVSETSSNPDNSKNNTKNFNKNTPSFFSKNKSYLASGVFSSFIFFAFYKYYSYKKTRSSNN